MPITTSMSVKPINNAGILKTPNTRTEAGREVRFDMNTIAPYILIKELLPILTKEGRVVNLSSAAQAEVDVATMTTFKQMADMEAYAQSKLAITIWTAEMAKHMPEGSAFIAVKEGFSRVLCLDCRRTVP